MNNKIIIGNLINYNDYINSPSKKYAQIDDDKARAYNDMIYTIKWELIKDDKEQFYQWLDSRESEFNQELFDALTDMYDDYITELIIDKINYEYEHSDKYTELDRKLRIIKATSNWKEEFKNPKWANILVNQAISHLKDDLNGPLWDVSVIKDYVQNKIDTYE